GEVHITATIDGNVKLIFEASIRRYLKLEDSDGISTLPNSEIFKQLALIGYASNSDKLTFQKGHFSPQWSFNFSKMIFEGMVKNLDSRVKDQQSQLSPNTHPQAKKVYSTAVIKLIMKVKRLEKIVKSSKARRRVKIVVSNDEDILEDSSKQGRMIEDIDQDARITLVTPKKATRVHTYSRRRRTISTGSGKVSTASRIISTADETISTAGVLMPVSTAVVVQESTPSPRATKNKGKAIMTEYELE
nr:hypothetical protein [Tanacetum cinerariifolium]